MKFWKLASAVTVLVLSTNVNAALIGRLAATEGGTDYQAYYDTEANLTWLADANYAETSGYAAANAIGDDHSSPANIQADGRMGWEAANTWAAGLNVGGVDGWRLADTVDVDNIDTITNLNGYQNEYWGYNVTVHSELSNMFFNVLGNTSQYDTNAEVNQSNWGLSNTGPFSNLQSGGYWSATEFALSPTRAWLFNMENGFQWWESEQVSLYAWAVQSGDVAVSAVPVPASVWLFGSGLIGLVGMARRRKH